MNLSELTDTQKILILKAKEAKIFSYSPYSNFAVGSSVLTDSGEIFNGCNVENASFGLTICAERVAIFKAVSAGFRKFLSIAVVTSNGDDEFSQPVAPCGACRQVINEFSQISGINTEVILVNDKNNSISITSIDELLPHSFNFLKGKS